MKTLLSVNNYHYLRGGAEFVFLKHNDMFSSHGWRVVPFAMEHPRNIGTPWQRYFAGEIEYDRHYGPVQTLANVGKAIYSFEARKKLRRLIDAARPAIAHCHNIYHHLSPAVLHELSAAGIRTVMTLHDLKIACPAYSMLARDGICERCKKNKIYNVLLHRCMKGSIALSGVILLESALHRVMNTYCCNVDRFIVPSRFYIEKFVQWGFDREQFVHIPNFVEQDKYVPGSDKGETLLFFGRLGKEKGLETLIEAAKTADVPVQIAGTGPMEDGLKRYAADTGAKVTFSGFLSGKALHDAIRSARATVLPSEWYENAPISVLESYALGTPVIGASIGGIPELIVEGETGFTFQSGDAGSLADRIAEMKHLSTRSAARMGANGRRWVESDFSATAYMERVSELYASLAA
jgi:glycosyltransferase involved in cell wall biosynthesis